jgi:2',3'-cyclic-nucleotide 2'-phosphodiesterase (5'-nucleotidase family)
MTHFQNFIINGPIYDCRDPKIIQPAATKINAVARAKLARTQTQQRYHAIHTIQSTMRSAMKNKIIQEPRPNIYNIRSEIRKVLVSAYTAFNPYPFSNTVIPQDKLNLS